MSGSCKGFEVSAEDHTNAPIPKIAMYRETAAAAAAQWRESTGEQPKITCAGCQIQAPIRFLFRCLYCGIWYCKTCAEDHFGETRADYLLRAVQTP